MSNDHYPEITDFAVVGAGCAGLYCAWRLSEQKPSPTIHVFESESRVGGRLLSVDLLPKGRRKAELGGMRFTEGQRLITHLVNHLRSIQSEEGMDIDHPLSMRGFNFDTHFMYLRGRRLLGSERWWEKDKLPYQINSPGEKLSQIVMIVLKRALQKAVELAEKDSRAKGNENLTAILARLLSDMRYGSLTSHDWRLFQEEATIEGIALHTLGFWNLLQHCLSEDADEFLFLHDALGYESLVANTNAAQALPMFLANFDVPEFNHEADTGGYKTLKGGMDSLPRLLHFYCRQKKQCIVADHHRVLSITQIKSESTSDHHFALRVRCTPSLANKELFYQRTYFAKNVILAVPKNDLKNIKLIGFDKRQTALWKERLDTVTAHPAFKLFLVYPNAWWSDECNAELKARVPLKARATTDLPLRQVYYLGENGHSKEKSLVMASYSDEHYVDFWEPLVNDPERPDYILKLRELAMSQREEISAYASDNAASKRIIDKAVAQLNIMHGKGVASDPEFGVVKEWKDAWHSWNVHVKLWDTATEMIRPFKERNMFVCGEAYSLEQGWVEGALKSAERVLRAVQLKNPLALFDNDDSIEEYILH